MEDERTRLYLASISSSDTNLVGEMLTQVLVMYVNAAHWYISKSNSLTVKLMFTHFGSERVEGVCDNMLSCKNCQDENKI